MRAAIAATALMVPVMLVACGDDDGGSDADDSRRAEIGGVAELAVGAYASVGPEALADYMSADALERCPREQLQVVLAKQPAPTGFKELKDVDFDGDEARATITISTKDGEKDINLTYVEEDGNWRIANMPGLENCGASGQNPGDTRITQEISRLVESALDAYALTGPSGLHAYLLPELAQRCSKAGLVTALGDQLVATGLRRLEHVIFERHVVRATVVQLVEQRETGTEWQFWITPAPGSGKATKDSPRVWRIANMPGLENCGS